jgi:hypothetical protein
MEVVIMLKKFVSRFLITLLLASFIPMFSSVANADTNIPQAGANPIVFNQTATTDNLIYLMAAGSEHNSSLTIDNYGAPKHAWVNNFFGRTTDYMQWTVNLPAAAVYHVDMLLSNNTNTPLRLSVVSTGATLNFTTNNFGWDKLDAGTISLPAGTSTIKLIGTAGSAHGMTIKSLELMRNSDLAAYQSRIASFKKDTTWLSNAGYGVMFQYGGWGYPQSGSPQTLDNQAANFNVTNFVNMVKNTGATYVIWSATWWTYAMDAPISQVDSIVGNGNRTSSRDLIGDVAAALHAQGIKFMLYYHTGQDSHLGYNSTDFWQHQNWPSAFTTTGIGDRSTFFTNWTNIITAMGNRYGTNLDGWFFDDGGMMYYPAPFEQLGQAARAGNPNRLISYNPWVASRITDFQDVYFAEESHGETQQGSAPVGGNGVFTSGPQKGLLQQAMFRMEQDWGVHAANTSINTGISSSQSIGWMNSAKSRRVPLSFNMMMWENGTVSASSLQVLTDVKNSQGTGTVYNKIKNHTTGKVLNGNCGADGCAVTQWSDVTSTNLQWQVIDLGNGYVKIKNRTDGKVLNGGGGTDGSPVSEWSDVTSNNLQWQVINLGNGYVKIKNRTDGKVLNGGGLTNDGAALTEWSDVTSTNLEWQIIPN